MKRSPTPYLATALVLALGACAQQSYIIEQGGGPGAGDDAGAGGDAAQQYDEAGNPIGDANVTPPMDYHLAAGITVTDVAVFQGVKVTIVKGGSSATPNAPVVANRDALVRVYVKSDGSTAGKSLVAYLTVTSGSGGTLTRQDTKAISGASTDASAASLFQFLVPAASMQTDATFSVKVVDPQGTGPSSGTPAQYPSDGSSAPMDVTSSGAQLKIWLFPVVTNGVTPPTDGTLTNTLKDIVYDLYPIPSVEITVKPAVTYPGSAPAADGNGWDQMLNWFLQKRQNDGPPNDVYYYGSFTPDSSFASYCSGGCVAGLSSLAQNPTDVWARASIGLGYGGDLNTDEETAFTMAHEVGHAHGRQHADCGGASGVDPSFPYSGGGIGVWGYALNEKVFIDPSKGHDMMGYCPDYDWISDYTFDALFKRLKAVNGADVHYAADAFDPRPYRMLKVAGDGTLTWGEEITVRTPVLGDERTLSFSAAGGVTTRVTGFYYAYDHLPGGYMLVPVSTLGFHALPSAKLPAAALE